MALAFTGVADNGVTLLPPGTYQPVIRITGDHRTITLPNKIEIDRTPPEVVRFPKRVYTHISPDGDHRNDVFSEPLRAERPGARVLLVDNRQAVFTRSQKVRGALTWNGTVDGKKLRPGPLRALISAQDAAGNRSKPFPFAVVTIRYSRSAATRSRGAAAPLCALRAHRRQEISWLFDRGRGSSARTRSGCVPRASPAATACTSRRRGIRRKRP